MTTTSEAAIGVTGALATAYLTGAASFKAAKLLQEEGVGDRDYPAVFESEERVQLVWKFYVPAVATAVLTVVCIVGANRIGS